MKDFFAGVDMSDEFNRPPRQLARTAGYGGCAIVPGSRPYPINAMAPGAPAVDDPGCLEALTLA
ncbi:hypothetical protein ParKJ_24390 [Paraburkholderia fungorum]|jgi:hypothetical protein|uniref:Uncharacterized protein n=1 Tax=Paraburkholderia fungorum TaxID=134537 RepID=A0AAP5UVQ2_9BURK|nr:hypothetical protein [Paraburkholderia fungorum]MDT8840568.1 hypothetical protein [Paraburkholderia fungorum]